jgi:hypothetical protein
MLAPITGLIIGNNLPSTGIRVTTFLRRDTLVVASIRAQVGVILNMCTRELVLNSGVYTSIVTGRGLSSAGLGLVAVEVSLSLVGDVAKFVLSRCHCDWYYEIGEFGKLRSLIEV